MPVPDIAGAAIGALFGGLLQPITSPVYQALKFKETRRKLANTVERLTPLVEERRTLNGELEGPREETERMFRQEVDESRSLLSRCSNIRWWQVFFLSGYQDQLQAMYDSLSSSMNILGVATGNVVMTVQQQAVGRQFRDHCKPPAKPDFIVGFDEPFNKSKIDLLREGSSVLVLTGLAGSGKTTLAAKLCSDEQVMGKFGKNILFITVSRGPNLKIIVQTLFEHCGFQVPQFQSDEDAIHRLGILLRQIGRSPMLLVLDDVWPGSESLVENFFQMPDYKILVTSRVAFTRFGPPIYLEPLRYDDAITLFRHFARLNDERSYINDDLVPKVVSSCGGSPLALEVIGKSLCGQQIVVWRNMVMELSKGHTTLDSNTELLAFLQKCLDVLEEKPRIKECFMDLGLFPEDQMIPAVALIDMWEELHKLDDEGIPAMNIINELATRNLANLRVTRKAASDEDNYYNNHFLMQHDLLRELAIYQSSQEPFAHRKRIIIDVKENNFPKEWEENQQGIIGSTLSLIFPRWLIQQKQQVTARILSISTDESLTPKWGNFQPAEVEVLVLNLRNQKYAFPNFMTKMRKVKVLIVTNYSFHSSELSNFMLLGSLSNLKRIRLEKVSVPSLCKLKNLQKLSLYMCNMSQAFQCHKIRISDALPNLAELNIDYGKDLVELPVGICDVIPLRKLSITNCHQFFALPQEIGKLQNLEVLRLSLCSKFEEIPNSINNLHKLTFLDISYCISLCKLADDMGNLCNLRKLCMTGCSRLSELPLTNLVNLEAVICDKETALLLEDFERMLPNLRIEVPEADINLNWLRGDGYY